MPIQNKKHIDVIKNPAQVEPQKKRTFNLRFLRLPRSAYLAAAIAGVVIAGALSALAIYHNFTHQSTDTVVYSVGKLMLLPKNEKPTVASVQDRTKLKNQFLAANAENGDQVLVYPSSHLLIIYRPTINKIVAVGTASVDPAYTEANGTSITVLDGSGNQDKTNREVAAIKAAYPSLKVTNGGNAARQDFTTTIVIDNTDQKDALMLALLDVVHGKQGILPLGIDASPTDMMIIVGKD